jgi:macrolide transport system ATP-binding/permease protein
LRTLRSWLLRLVDLFNKSHIEQELADEMEANLEFQIEDNLRAGMTPEQSRRAAMLKFGSLDAAKEAVRDRRGIPFLETLARDVS